MNLDDLIYRRSHPLLKAGRKSPSLFRALISPMEPMDLGDDDVRVYVYPEQEARREDLEILGQDFYAGVVKYLQEMESNEKTLMKRR